MNEQIQSIIDRARVLLAAATPGPLVVGVGEVETEDAGRHRAVLIHTDAYCVAACGSPTDPHSHADAEALAFAVNNIGTLCDAVVDAERRAEEARAEQTRHLLLTTVADLKAQKAEAQAGAGRVAIRMLMEDHDPHTYSRCEDRECDHVRLALSALASDAGRALLDRLTAAEAGRDALRVERDKLRADLAEEVAILRLAESRERMLERELLHIWAIVRPGEPTPPSEDHVRHAVAALLARVAAGGGDGR